jgi:hypothetical protein
MRRHGSLFYVKACVTIPILAGITGRPCLKAEIDERYTNTRRDVTDNLHHDEPFVTTRSFNGGSSMACCEADCRVWTNAACLRKRPSLGHCTQPPRPSERKSLERHAPRSCEARKRVTTKVALVTGYGAKLILVWRRTTPAFLGSGTRFIPRVAEKQVVLCVSTLSAGLFIRYSLNFSE